MCDVTADCSRQPTHHVVVSDAPLRACGRCLARLLQRGVARNPTRMNTGKQRATPRS